MIGVIKKLIARITNTMENRYAPIRPIMDHQSPPELLSDPKERLVLDSDGRLILFKRLMGELDVLNVLFTLFTALFIHLATLY
jgi:hypothetical protein